MDPNVKDSIVARLKEATNVLVTVSNNPSVDQLAACIGFTLLLNKVGKRGAAVFSGAVPSTLEFLQPDKTIEKNTDSLRDFIIALDKSKADKLRYKVEDKVVKIFITPYRTSIDEKDLDFSQGDFNVDVVVALGVHEKSELDEAIVSHGRILHDATVISVNNKDQGSLGTLNWVDLQSSSLSEMMASIGQVLGGAEAFDNQIATALMTGIVAETDRFSNEKTSPATMKLASDLMGAGANQQLIATKLEEPAAVLGDAVTPKDSDDGELTIEHDPNDDKTLTEIEAENAEEPELELPEPKPEDEAPHLPDSGDTEGPGIDDVRPDDSTESGPTQERPTSMTLEPPTLGGKLTANSEPEHLSLDPSTDPLSAGVKPAGDGGILSRSSSPSLSPLSDEATTSEATPAEQPAEEPNEEKIEDAREAVEEAIIEGGDPEKNIEPIQALGAQPVNLDLGHDQSATEPAAPVPPVESPTPLSPTPTPADVPPAVPSPEPFQPPAEPSGEVSMPPTPVNTPPVDVMPPAPSNPSLDSGNFINPNPSPVLTPPTDVPTEVPTNLVPPSAPTDQSGAAGPATPPPPVPPPMSLPPMPPAPPQP